MGSKGSKVASTPAKLSEAGRKLANLALDRLRQDGVLVVRQRETLRRTLAFAGDAFEWDLLPGTITDRVAAAKNDVRRLAVTGADDLDRDIKALLVSKTKELDLLRSVAVALRGLAGDMNASYPAQIEVSFTHRSALGHLVTKTEALTLGDAGEALRNAEDLESREEGREKLRDQMIEELKERRRQLSAMRRDLPSFVESSDQLVAEVLAIPS
jgi:hypothetical protein